MEIINLEKKKAKLSTKKQQELYQNAKNYYICKEKFEDKIIKDKKYYKLS